jgi:hypothetical protein
MRSMGEGHPPVVAISRSCPVETLRQYNLTQESKTARGQPQRAQRREEGVGPIRHSTKLFRG